MRCLVRGLMAFVMSGVVAANIHAAVVFVHSGSSTPETEGWLEEPVALLLGPRPEEGPVTGDMGLDAWSIDDNSSAAGTNRLYTQTPTATENGLALSSGWVLRSRVRVVDTPDAIGNAGSVMMEYSDGTTAFTMALGSEADGDPIVLLSDGGIAGDGSATGTQFTLQGGGSGYHLYELVFDPVAGSADLFIDGVQRISDYSGVSGALFNRVAWGSSSSADQGQGNWNLVEWEITTVPLPASLPLLLSGLTGFGWLLSTRKHRSASGLQGPCQGSE